MPGRGAPVARPPSAGKTAPSAKAGAQDGPDAAAQIHETAAQTVKGAKQLWGNLSGLWREAQSAVADQIATLQGGEEGAGPLGRRRVAEPKGAPAPNTAALKRREIAKADAEQYFVEYSGLDVSRLPQEIVDTRSGRQ